MTEAEWTNGCRYRPMYEIIRRVATLRQTRLYMAACCRNLTNHFFNAGITRSLETVELCADDPHIESTVSALNFEMVTSPSPNLISIDPTGKFAQVVADAWALLDETWTSPDYSSIPKQKASEQRLNG